jgi:hypothetical protein
MRVYSETLGRRFSEGARLLWLAVRRHCVDLAGLVEATGRTKGAVSRWLHGHCLPDADSRIVLFEKYAIPVAAWSQPPKKEFRIVRSSSRPTVTTASTERN